MEIGYSSVCFVHKIAPWMLRIIYSLIFWFILKFLHVLLKKIMHNAHLLQWFEGLRQGDAICNRGTLKTLFFFRAVNISCSYCNARRQKLQDLFLKPYGSSQAQTSTIFSAAQRIILLGKQQPLGNEMDNQDCPVLIRLQLWTRFQSYSYCST